MAYVLLALLRIPRPETLKQYAPDGLGHIVGLDRMPEVKTLRRKLARLANMKRSRELGRELAQRRVRERGRLVGFLYVDGHVRAYHGKHSIPKAFLEDGKARSDRISRRADTGGMLEGRRIHGEISKALRHIGKPLAERKLARTDRAASDFWAPWIG